MKSTHTVVLVPGFFGFGALGKLNYFVGVQDVLQNTFTRRSVDAVVVEVPTLPTASIRRRAARLLEVLANVTAESPGPVHVIGHSTGGLDARLALAPTASLPTETRAIDYDRVHTLVTVSTPHFGTPLADFFGSAAGYPLLRMIAGLSSSMIEHFHVPLGLLLRLGRALARADDWLGLRQTVADDLLRDLVQDFSAEKRAELLAFINDVSHDQSLVFQLTPAACDLLNASTADPKNLRYGSVVCAARPPRLSGIAALKHDPYAQLMHAVYAGTYRATARTRNRFPDPVPEQGDTLMQAFGTLPGPSWSDGIVPTLSQIWGDVLHATHADHLDVVGHYGAARADGRTTDWLPSRSGFDDAAFERLWCAVANYIADGIKLPPPTCHRKNVGTERTQAELSPSTPDRPPTFTPSRHSARSAGRTA